MAHMPREVQGHTSPQTELQQGSFVVVPAVWASTFSTQSARSDTLNPHWNFVETLQGMKRSEPLRLLPEPATSYSRTIPRRLLLHIMVVNLIVSRDGILTSFLRLF
jgi:hypothetical protein